jgi:hypothetical protein
MTVLLQPKTTTTRTVNIVPILPRYRPPPPPPPCQLASVEAVVAVAIATAAETGTGNVAEIEIETKTMTIVPAKRRTTTMAPAAAAAAAEIEIVTRTGVMIRRIDAIDLGIEIRSTDETRIGKIHQPLLLLEVAATEVVATGMRMPWKPIMLERSKMILAPSTILPRHLPSLRPQPLEAAAAATATTEAAATEATPVAATTRIVIRRKVTRRMILKITIPKSSNHP